MLEFKVGVRLGTANPNRNKGQPTYFLVLLTAPGLRLGSRGASVVSQAFFSRYPSDP